jgi:signal recognition particle receptor subunit beta
MRMAVYNYESGEINIKVVYYGPGLSGKTTNLEHIYSKLPKENKGKMVSMKTRTDRTLFFDFLPIDVGEVNKMKLRFLLYTVPGQVYYNATRKLVLKGVDAVVFVADSAPDRMQDNRESLQNLEENLNDLGLTLRSVPWVIQFNKRDLPNAVDKTIMYQELDTMQVPAFESVATTGEGVYETLEGIGRIVFTRLQRELQSVDHGKKPKERPSEQEIKVEVVAKGRSGASNSEAGKSESLDNAEKREEEHESVSEFVDNVLKEDGTDCGSVNLGATREGYEEYGHLVELSDEEAKPGQPTAEEEFISDPLEKLDTKTGQPAAEEEFMSDPLEKLDTGSGQPAAEQAHGADPHGESGAGSGQPAVEPAHGAEPHGEPGAGSGQPAAGGPPESAHAEQSRTGSERPSEPPIADEPAGAAPAPERVVRVPVVVSEDDIGKELPVKVILEIKLTSH